MANAKDPKLATKFSEAKKERAVLFILAEVTKFLLVLKTQ